MEVLDHIWSLERQQRGMALVLIWEWWTARNKANAGEQVRSTDNICYAIRQHIQDFSQALVQAKQGTNPVMETWQWPPADSVKISFDAAIYADTGHGMCLPYRSGSVLGG